MTLQTRTLPLLCAALVLSGCNDNSPQPKDTGPADKAAQHWPVLQLPVSQQPELEQRISDMMAKMTLGQKIAQMMQPEIRDISVEDMRQYGFGSFLNGGGAFPNDNKHATPQDWIALAEAMYQASVDASLDGSSIPAIWGTDAVHGHNNVIGATLFPHNIGLGAAHNPALIEQIARVTAREVMVTGIDWVFAPTVAVARDDRWGRTYESYSENPAVVHDYAAAIVKGLQGAPDADFLGSERVISTVKHFIGDGGTVAGDDQGDNIATEQQLFDIHAQGYVGGLQAGAQTVMASFNSWHGSKIHGDKYLLTEVLKDRMGFDGFVVGDWNGHGQIPGCTNDNCAQAALAGLDMYMVPTPAWKPLYHNLIAQAESGELPLSRIDDAVRRILRVKLRAGLFDKPSPAKRPLSGKTELIGSAEHRAVAHDAVQQSLVLLKNNDKLLPLVPTQRILITGEGADNIGMQSGGWSISWQGTGNSNSDFPGGSSIYAGIKQAVDAAGGQLELSTDGSYQHKPDVAVVVFGEQPYAEGNGDLDNLEFQRGNKTALALLHKLKADGIKVVSLFISGRPLWVNPELNASDAFVAVWLPGSEGVGVADVIMAKADGSVNVDFRGKLSFSWPATPQQQANVGDNDYQPLLPYGFGLRYGEQSTLSNKLNEQVALDNSLADLVLFERAVKPPYQLVLHSDGQSQNMDSSVAQLGNIAVRTFDNNVQEDARRLSFSGEAKVSLSSAFPADLRTYQETHSSLQITLQHSGEIPELVLLGIDCAAECAAQVNIAPQLRQLAAGKWHALSVDLGCFAGVDFGRVFTPMSLATKTPMQLSFSDVRLIPRTAEQATIRCSAG
ncbi:glycoside hydrolase family 3 C-terminal domain-containing protein [Rheinheimera muenzenbergensis]|uniref:Glycoside hydrolase family 3 C-terminal domain-containing protein n=1 Tax=Rheinheimera muenzenbergensis TaxID=1193628 RepID=A0ABU8CCA0_9GAMM